ncbi:hypothetical protein ASPFODRAFT_287172 [Aspergillus luchuensis CBS 106.47]|uniref:Uncharacterized protein n=1 Tax=Aspergillus luchuensis (strain CBS 106.47) TaxID=1137211 RepID=A0A1M3TAH5_ASPLC|nr:hypothetical protein ASPFODRAFT_287172 [Aspergillus luchuensis CBS 106.47]
MFNRATYRFPTTLYRARRSPSARYLHRVTADLQNYDSKGNLVTEKVPVIAGDPGETYLQSIQKSAALSVLLHRKNISLRLLRTLYQHATDVLP